MGYLDPVLQRQTSGKYDFVVKRGNPKLTEDQSGPILRLLLQGPWLADNGERDGESLQSVRMESQSTESRIRGISESRVLVSLKRIEQFTVLSVKKTVPGVFSFAVQVKQPGQSPQPLQFPL